jgi:glycosyltransferase involved in cell wall biosynthesis
MYRNIGEYDVMVVGYPGQFDVYLARFLTFLRRKPLVMDVLMSIFLVAMERKLDQRSYLTVAAIKYLERIALHLPDLLIIEGLEYRDWIVSTHHIDPSRFKFVPLGAESISLDMQENGMDQNGKFTVLYYGTFVPSHSVETIVQAAAILQDDASIQFNLIGIGPEREKAMDLAQSHGLKNITFSGFVERDELERQINLADVCLGVFGTSLQSNITIQNKIFEPMAMGKAIITGESPAIRKAFNHGEHLLLCERINPEALSDAIRSLKKNPALRQNLGNNAKEHFYQNYDPLHIGKQFIEHLNSLT